MLNKKIGFIGSGKMAEAIIGGLIKSELVPANQIFASAKTRETVEKIADKYAIQTTIQNREVAAKADMLILAVKPDLHKAVIEEIKDIVKSEAVIITIAAGITLDFLETTFGHSIKAVRVMPNTPSLVGEGMSAICSNDETNAQELQEVIRLFESFGKAEVLPEKLMDAVPAVSGSSPAYVYMFIEALADGAVQQGIARNQAYTMAAQAVLGAAKMVLETGKHPGELKDNVCTPGGATIEAVTTLEKHGFRSAVVSAMEACTEKSKRLKNSK
ncbi:pyrroline-5-carboxylate reductase [Sutcliffiella horikoshii]|uniref:Pyrroline-5-carboxylate reductase n=1 Tax=Sutcliffiella horikoshii TaxID=79883 RepID=A0A1Y0CJT1_9BACI|nr:pyrroline-5-carboxylate reductase [Sutcliffiella horikoshii]ART75540.1 pyrroline-5-carboxylate reductase [Sutcliffiella horikoshii]TYS60822.1 pyrroline-5-carboxylate reductase [Sutcliffiella horikoshii]